MFNSAPRHQAEVLHKNGDIFEPSWTSCFNPRKRAPGTEVPVSYTKVSHAVTILPS